MSEFGIFYESQQVDYNDLVAAYQEAFKEDPWNEVSKCVDETVPQRCPGGMSALAIGEWCRTCAATSTIPAYEAAQLVERFSGLAETRPTLWYIERIQGRVALAAVCWLSNAEQLVAEKYTDVPAMEPWIGNKLGEGEFIYLDEIFRDRTVRATGNLRNLKPMFVGFGQYFAQDRLVYRSKQPRLMAKTKQVFGEQADMGVAGMTVPDWRERDFVIVDLGGQL